MFSNSKKSIVKPVKSKAGFSLVEVMVATVVVSVVGLGIASVMSDMAKSQKGVREASSIQEAVNSINMVLAKNDSCKDAIKGPGGNPINEGGFSVSTAAAPLLLSSVNFPTVGGVNAIITTGQPLPGTPSLIVESIKLINSGVLRNGQNNPSTVIQQDAAGLPITFRLYVGTIEVNFAKNPAFANASMSASNIKRSFRATIGFAQQASASFGVAAGQLGLCNAESSASQECQSMLGGVFNPANASPQCHIPTIASEVGFSIKTSASSSNVGTTQLNIAPTGDITIGSGSPAPLFVKSGGSVGIGTNAPTTALDVKGSITASQSVNAADILASQTVRGTRVIASQSVEAASGNIGGCQLSGGAINCPNSITSGGGTTTINTTLSSMTPLDMELIKQQVCQSMGGDWSGGKCSMMASICASLSGFYNASTGKCTINSLTTTLAGTNGTNGGNGTNGTNGGNGTNGTNGVLPDGTTIASKVTSGCDAACVVRDFFARNTTGNTVANADKWMASVGQASYTTYAGAYSMDQTLGSGGVALNAVATGNALGYNQNVVDNWTVGVYNQYNSLPTTPALSGATLYQNTVTGYNNSQSTWGNNTVNNYIQAHGEDMANAAAMIVANATSATSSGSTYSTSQTANAVNEAASKYTATEIANYFANGGTVESAISAGYISGK